MIKSKSVVKILNSKPPSSVVWAGTKPYIKGKHYLFFNKHKNGTEVINYEEFTGIALPSLALLNMEQKIQRSFMAFNKGLKKEAESN